MLEALRKAAHSFVAKILFGLLIVSFAVWGIGDVVRVGVSNRPAIVAGNVEVSAAEVINDYRREVTRLQRVFGPQFTEEQARQMGLLTSTIEQVSARALLEQAARDLDLTASDDAVMQSLTANPAFRNELGQFDRFRLRQAISQAGFGEEEFLALVRKDLMRAQLIGALSDGVAAPDVLARSLFAHRAEKRVADLLTFPADRMPNPAAPDEAALKAYHESQAQSFMAPEYRSVGAIVLRPADVAGEVKITDQDLQDAYHQRAADFIEPERRTLKQIVFAAEDKAQAAAQVAQQGKDLAAVAAETGESVVELGQMDREAVSGLSADLADAAFALPQPGITPPVRTPFGWHLVAVTEIQPGKEKPLAEVQDQLREEVLRERAVDRLYELANKVEDALAGGASLAEAAAKLNLKVVQAAAVDPQGRTPEGKPAEGLPVSQAFLKTVFETPEGAETRTTELENNGGFFVARVEKVTPPAVKPFESVRDDVLKAWQAEQRLAAARQKAEQALAALKEGKAPAEVAQAAGIEARTTEPFTRSPAANAGVAAPVAAEAFRLQQGQAALVNTPDGAVVAQLKTVIPADPQADAALLDQIRQQLTQQMTGDVVDQAVAALQDRYGVTVNRGVIEERLK